MEKNLDAKAALDSALELAVKENASDLHLNNNEPFLLRIGSGIAKCESGLLTADMIRDMVYSIMTERQVEIFERDNEIDFSYESDKIQGARFRVNLGVENKSDYATFRVVPNEIRDVRKIGFPNDRIWQEIIGLNNGLVLVTGVTGSGKTTTLASLIQELNSTRNEYIICIEDPIEYKYRQGKGVVVQREVGRDTNSFATGVKMSLRQDPDTILIAEIRDTETAKAALTAAETGHLVFATLHTKSAAGTIDRYINLFPSGDQNEVRSSLSSGLAYVISQQLIPYESRDNRVLAMEIMKNTMGIKNLIRKGEIHQIQGAIQMGTRDGMITMDAHLERLYRIKKITREVAVQYAADRDELERKIE